MSSTGAANNNDDHCVDDHWFFRRGSYKGLAPLNVKQEAMEAADHVTVGVFDTMSGGLISQYAYVTFKEQIMCNENCEVWLILGMHLGLAGWKPTIPPEIVLLTHL